MANETKRDERQIRRSRVVWIGGMACVLGGVLGYLSGFLYFSFCTGLDSINLGELRIGYHLLGLFFGIVWGAAAGFLYPYAIARLARRRAEKGLKVGRRGLLSGTVTGMICSICVHLCLLALIRHNPWALLIGLPFGAVAGLLLGVLYARIR